MTTIRINEKGCKNNNVSLSEITLLISIYSNYNTEAVQDKLIKEGYITARRNNFGAIPGYNVTRKGTELIDNVIVDSEPQQKTEEELKQLATTLKAIFPRGKKSGTNYYWADGVPLIVRRLKLFFKKYGNDYTGEQIIQAANKYVKSFNGNYTYMRLLKYFILKEKTDASGDVEGNSELITYIENAGQEENLREDWTSTLR